MVPALGGAPAGGGTDLGAIIGQIAGGGIGGSVLLVMVGVVKQTMTGAPAK